LEKNGTGKFPEYQNLGISPLDVHRSKDEHKCAVFTLGSELARATSGSYSGNGVSTRLRELAERYQKPSSENEIGSL
jgi:hypothetical protein